MKTTELELAGQSHALARNEAVPTGLSIEQVFQAVVEKNISPENIAVMKQLLAMDAERKFNAAFVQLQSELPVIVAKTEIKNRGRYEKFEDLMTIVQPLLSKNGFTVSFTNDFKDTRIIETCHLSHSGGFSRINSFAVRVGTGDTPTQADCKAATTAKRNALMNALNIVIRQDCLNEEDDASIEGDPNAFLTPDQACEIERRVKETNSNVPAFLKFADADKFSTIAANKYTELDAMLRRKEAGK